MKYKNTKTGAIIYSPCVISGGDWEVVMHNQKGEEIDGNEEVPSTEEEAKEEKEEKEEDQDESTIEGVTKKQIMQELDAMGIKYDPKARKEELYNLMNGK